MGVTQRQTQQLQPRRLPERVPGSFLLQQLQTFSSTSQTPRTTVKMAVSKIRQNYHEDCEALINKQINMKFYASYVYLSMSSYFNGTTKPSTGSLNTSRRSPARSAPMA